MLAAQLKQKNRKIGLFLSLAAHNNINNINNNNRKKQKKIQSEEGPLTTDKVLEH